MFSKKAEQGFIKVLPGIQRKTLVYGEQTLMSEFILAKDALLPVHQHGQEQTGYLVSGRMLLSIGSETFEVNPGDSWTIPGGVEHGAQPLLDSVALEVFAPIREDYLP
ncbi:MAG TPA: cupin domain-containing protein [Syntrophomonadaceae bacterium]|nr:cupin domain-containing protein [Syntrophomonadaceae bacterium]